MFSSRRYYLNLNLDFSKGPEMILAIVKKGENKILVLKSDYNRENKACFEISSSQGSDYEGDCLLLLRRVDLQKFINFHRFLLPSSSGRLMKKAVRTSEMSVNFYKTKRRNFPKEIHLQDAS